MRNVCFLALSLFLWNHYSFSQPGQYRFSRVDISQGLSNNEVNSIFRDERGFMWFGTRSGLNRYDGSTFKIFKHDLRDSLTIADEEVNQIFEGPNHTLWLNTKSKVDIYDLQTEKFNHHAEAILRSLNIPDNYLFDLKKDKQNNFWFLGTVSGLYKYDIAKKTTMHFDAQDTGKTKITGFATTGNGTVWIVRNDGLIKLLDAQTGRIITTITRLQNISPKNINAYSVYADKTNGLWIYPPGIALGVYYYNIPTGSITHIKKGNTHKNLNNDVIRGISEDENGLIWIATDHGGINLVDKKTFTLNYLLNQQDDEHSIAQNSIDVLFIDSNNIVWLGTFKKGICYYHKDIIKFPLYHNQPSDAASLPFNDINSFTEDAEGKIWIGTNGGGLICFNRKTGKYTQYKHSASDESSLSNDVIVSLCIGQNQTLWIGTYFGGLDHFDGKTFTHYRHDNANADGISDNAIWSVMEDERHRLWIGTFSSGLDIFDASTEKFEHHKPSSLDYVQSSYVSNIKQAANGDIWLATSMGVDVVKKSTGQVIHYMPDASKPATSLSNENVIALLQDSRGLMWIATREGLDYFNEASGTFTTLRKEDGMADNIMLSLAEDANHNLWAGTPSGLTNIIIKSDSNGGLVFRFKNYDETDGLQGKEFNEYSALATRDGELLFGGANGFNMFRPQQVNSKVYEPDLMLTGLQIFNKDVAPGEKLNGQVILPQSVTQTKSIRLRYNQNIFSIEFAALNFFNKSKLRYAYTLKGFNREWFFTDDKTHKATYTNIDPGSYTFKVKTVNENGVWSKDEITLNIEIMPPFWKTTGAYILYVLLLVFILYLARTMVVKRAKARFALEQERKEAQRLHELDMMKIKFFTNLSHEFRTPLSLILTPMEKIIKSTADAVRKHQLLMVQRNARRLLNLVNELLDFRQMEKRELKLCVSESNIVGFIKDVADSFIDLAEKKHISFSITSERKKLEVLFDKDKIERIMLNLLSNAFKFTPENGSVSLHIAACKKPEFTEVQIKVTDTGIGISADKHEKIFDYFYQSDLPESMLNQGSGIGLSITKEFVRLHNGTISVESEPGVGSCFTVALPLKETSKSTHDINTGKEAQVENETEETLLPDELKDAAPGEKAKNKIARKPSVLIIEDNDDMRFYLKDNLKQYFNITEAANGKAGWQKALFAHPDVIISDINMPEMNGIDLCRKLKSDKRTSYAPVILLTAVANEELQLNGLGTGASDYITKPFNFEILLTKVKNLLAQQETARRTYQKQVIAQPADINIDSPEQKFIRQALEVMEKEIANPEFSVEHLSRKLFISRVALYKKLLALTGKTPLDFIRSFRLKRSAQLLEQTQLTVSEVAYEVGFNNPKYFSRFFKAEFNMLPSAYQAMKRNNADKGEATGQNYFLSVNSSN